MQQSGPLSSKNLMLSSAVQSLGLGDQLKQQLDDQEIARKKKLLQNATNTASMDLFGGGM